jgi:chemotaxis protein methyltransferase CheR
LRVRILATDISSTILARAREGTYSTDVLRDVPPAFQKYFEVSGSREARVARKVRDLVKFGRLNLLDDWPMRRRFQLIFCRNVMIYFDKSTQVELARRFAGALEDGGHLFIGHSESLGTAETGLRYVRPAVYLR